MSKWDDIPERDPNPPWSYEDEPMCLVCREYARDCQCDKPEWEE